jgi:hypothetical protein
MGLVSGDAGFSGDSDVEKFVMCSLFDDVITL